jgi:hypothetical protein
MAFVLFWRTAISQDGPVCRRETQALKRCIVAYLAGVLLALIAAFSGSVSPDGPRTAMGAVLASVYQPYFEQIWRVCFYNSSVAMVVSLALSGVPFAAAAFAILWWSNRS